MRKLRRGFIVLGMLLGLATAAAAQVNIGIGLPHVSIGINLPLFPELVPVPGYPVYYAPRVDANYFFFDGMYWVYRGDNWYASSWYDGPWGLVEPEIVPLFILRVPVRYYRQPPVYFRGWRSSAPPRWGKHWGHGWEERRKGWDKWERKSVPAAAPLPVYQRQYQGDRYPRGEQQVTLHRQHYRYEPRDQIVRQHFRQVGQSGPGSQPSPPAAKQERKSAADQPATSQRGQELEDRKQQPRLEKREQQEPRPREGQGKNSRPDHGGDQPEPQQGDQGQRQKAKEEHGRGRSNN